ncbi:thioesterase family protein [Conexibacter sp. CPCC 206217]|uniref:acyl-CoA thioesterase n=1 Tax=Conexibacter sp. CPCC 206217 TaxID=3064574 RepID=UPI002717D346|nr:acyl-CoA thioesterase [Conexibacter sp. CPCC 206217]MDO8209227.1 acyl-CoA thioesterase [Conexibacter sp. CPCC 206217]
MSDATDRTLRLTLQLRLNDFDVLGHLNQAVYHELLEQGRIGILTALGADSNRYVLARVELDYRREIAATVREAILETSVEGYRRSSIRLSQRVLRPDGELAAEGFTVLVGWDGDARRSRPLDAAERAALAEWIVPAAA